jgi:hypothetical protein
MEICVRCETPDTRNRFECVSADGDRMCGECIEEDNLLNGSDDGKARYAEILTGWSEEKADAYFDRLERQSANEYRTG